MPEVPMATRLAVYGLTEADAQPTDLRLEPGQQLTLSAQDTQFSAQMKSLRPQSVLDLKRWIGVPDEALAAVAEPVHRDLPLISSETLHQLTAEDHNVLAVAGQSAVFGHSATIHESARENLDRWAQLVAEVSVFLYQDVYVSAGAQLGLQNGGVLFARNITVEHGGQIMVGTVGSIDCASFEGLIGGVHSTIGGFEDTHGGVQSSSGGVEETHGGAHSTIPGIENPHGGVQPSRIPREQ